MKRYEFSRRTRFRYVEQDGSNAGDFEIERRTPHGHLMATSLEHGSPRTFTLAELRQAIAQPGGQPGAGRQRTVSGEIMPGGYAELHMWTPREGPTVIQWHHRISNDVPEELWLADLSG